MCFIIIYPCDEKIKSFFDFFRLKLCFFIGERGKTVNNRGGAPQKAFVLRKRRLLFRPEKAGTINKTELFYYFFSRLFQKKFLNIAFSLYYNINNKNHIVLISENKIKESE